MPKPLPSTDNRSLVFDEIDWRRTRGTITEDGRVVIRMTDGTKNPPWLELDDAGQHWILAMIQQAQAERQEQC